MKKSILGFLACVSCCVALNAMADQQFGYYNYSSISGGCTGGTSDPSDTKLAYLPGSTQLSICGSGYAGSPVQIGMMCHALALNANNQFSVTTTGSGVTTSLSGTLTPSNDNNTLCLHLLTVMSGGFSMKCDQTILYTKQPD